MGVYTSTTPPRLETVSNASTVPLANAAARQQWDATRTSTAINAETATSAALMLTTSIPRASASPLTAPTTFPGALLLMLKLPWTPRLLTNGSLLGGGLSRPPSLISPISQICAPSLQCWQQLKASLQ